MTTSFPRQLLLFALRHAPVVLLAVVLLAFGIVSPGFLHPQSLIGIVAESASLGILAVGMTVVLLTAGLDLSVGAIMYVAAAAAGLLLRRHGISLGVAIPLMLAIGLAFGALNGLLIARGLLLPFIVTLATLYAGRGLALWITGTREMRVSDWFGFVAARPLGVPLAVWLLAAVVAAAHVLLTHTPFGRQLYALGHDAEAARKAGINTPRVLLVCYLISGLCAALAAVVSLGQLGSVSQTFGRGLEFEAVAAAVIGGVSLFGGRGRVFPGAVVGAVLLRAIYIGLVTNSVDPYVYTMVTAGIVFLAVLLDVARAAALKRLAGQARLTSRDREGAVLSTGSRTAPSRSRLV